MMLAAELVGITRPRRKPASPVLGFRAFFSAYNSITISNIFPGWGASPSVSTISTISSRPSDFIAFRKALELAATASNPFEAAAAESGARRLVKNGKIDPTRVQDVSFVSRINLAEHGLLKKLRDEYRAQHPSKWIVWRRGIKGARLPGNTVLVTRPSRWANPFVVRPDLAPGTIIDIVEGGYIAVPTAEEAVRRFRDDTMTLERREDARRELKGKDLACDCKLGAPCHADVLLEIANS